MITKARSPRWRMRRSFSSASHRGQPSLREALRYSIRQGAHSGCGASGVGRFSSAIVEHLKVVVFDTLAEVVQLPGGAVADVSVKIVEAVGIDEAGVGPDLDRRRSDRRGLRFNQLDKGSTEALAAGAAGAVQ